MLRFPKLKIIFIFAVLNLVCIASVKTGFISNTNGYKTNDSLPERARVATLTATINPSTLNVCQNDPGSILTFTGSGGSGSYTFIYKINGGEDLSIHTASGSSNVILNVPTSVVGIFTYTLVSVSDPSNSAQSQTGTATVTVVVKPDATLNSSGDLIYFNGYSTFTTCSSSSTEVTFTNASATTSTNLGYEISWGDGSSNFSGASWSILSHNYAVGFWDLTYTVTGSNGCVVTEMYKIFVGSNPAVSLGSPGNTNICANESLTFPITGTDSNPQGTTYTVTFNDGSVPQVFNHPPPSTVDHTFLLSSCGTTSFNGPISFPNSFSVNILASNPCGQSAVSVVPIYVSKQPVASFLSPDTIACTNNPVCIDNTSTGASLASATGCDKGYKIIWTISPSTGVILNRSSYGDDFGSANQNLWTSGSDIICPVFSLPGNYTITIKVANYCGIALSVKNICVEAPLVPQFNLNAIVGCAPLAITATNTTNYDNSCSSPVYLWEVDYVASNCGTSADVAFTNGTKNSASPSFEFTNPGTYKLKLSVTNSCGTDSTTQIITVKKPPTITVADISTLCQTFPATVINPSATAVNCGANPLNYQWSFPGGDPSTSAVLNPGPINYSLPGTYSVSLAVTNECGTTTVTGNLFTINATPTVNDIDNQAKCKDQLSDAIVFQGSVPGTVYNWTNDNTSFGLAASGTGNINPFILPNAGTELITATITVTPVLATGCTGVSKTFQISVHPEPVVNDISGIELCNNNIFTGINLSSPVLLTTFTWVNSNPNIGLPANGTGNIPGFNAINTGTTPQIATITITPANVLGCPGVSKIFTITVNPTPTSLVLSNKEFCNGVLTSPIAFSNAVSGTTYTWVNSNTNIGLAGSGSGDVPAFTPVNNGAVPVTSTITVTPSANACTGLSQIFTITVNPSPVISFTPGNQTLCTGDNSALVTLSSTTPGLTFNWTAVAPAGISGVISSGTNTIPVQTLENSTNAELNVIYIATALLNGNVSCEGAVFNYTITVKPRPLVSGDLLTTVCSEEVFTLNPTDGSGNIIPAGTSYTWSVPIINPAGALSGTSAQSTPQASFGQTITNNTITAATATYSVTPTTSNACSGPAFNVIVTVNPKPTVQQISDIVLCNGSTNTQLAFSGDVSGTVYSWTNDNTGIGLAASGSGPLPAFTAVNTTALALVSTITVTPTANGCAGLSKTFTITVSTPVVTSSIISNYSGYNISITGGNDGWIDLTVTGSSGVYSYLWSGPNGFTASTQDISNLVAGTYTLSLNDGMCDPIPLSFILIDPTEILVQEDLSSHVDVLCNGDSTGVIKIDVTQTSLAPYDYLLTNQSGIVVENAQNISDIQYSFIGLPAGTYTVRVTDATGNFKTISGIIITEPTKINVSITAQLNLICAGDNNGSATVTATGGTGALSYSWNTIPVQNTASATGLTAGTYTVTVMDAIGCQLVMPVAITQPIAIVSSVSSQTNVGCFGESTGSATVTASGGTGTLSYSWDTNPVLNSPTATGLAAGTYQVTITDANSCSYVQVITITQPGEILNSSITDSRDLSCFGAKDGTATVLATGGTEPYSYSWNTVPVQTTTTAIDLNAGNYAVTVTDANGCVSTTSVLITEPVQISAFISAQTNVYCSGNNTGSATVTASGGAGALSYSWNTVPVQTSPTATGLASGDYTVTVTDANNCNVLIAVTIAEPNAIITSISTQTNVLCFGESTGAATVAGSGGIGALSYSWNTNPMQTTPTATGLIAGTYQVTVTDANACFNVQEVIITQPADLLILTDNEKDVTCAGSSNGEINISVTGGSGVYLYSWTKNNISFAATEDLSNIGPGEYVVLVSDVNGCQPKSDSFSITEPPVLAVSLISKTNIICNGEATGAITVEVSGGTALEVLPGVFDYRYAWTGLNGYTNTGQNLTDIPAGSYQLTVTDALGCTNQLTVIITQPAELVINYTTTPVICYGSNNASITLTVSGGVTPYQISWSNLGSGLLQQDLSAGDYTITVIDAIGCQKIVSVDIPDAPIFTINPVVKNVSCFGENDGSITLNFRGGVPPVTLVWSDGSPAGTARNNLGPGTYSVTIRDGAPCSIKQTFVILEPQQLVLSANITNAFDCNTANSGTINLIVAGGTPPLTYVWSNGATTEDLIDIPAGNYLVTVTDSTGCVQTAQYAIQRQSPLAIAVATTIDFNCTSKMVTEICTAQITGGVSPYSLTWTGSGTVSGTYHQVMETSENGMVILTVTDALGCSATYAFNVEIPDNGISSSMIDCGNNTVQFNAMTVNPLSQNSYLWDFGDGTSSTITNPKHSYATFGTYKVRLTITGTSCTYSYDLIKVVEALPVLSLSPEPRFCKGDSILVTVSGAHTYNWFDGSTGNSIWIKQSGDFIVTGTSVSGCSSTLSFTASNYDLFNYTIQTDRNEVSADEPTLHVWSETTSPSQYFWDFGDGEVSQGNDLNHNYTVTGEGFYDINLKVINPGGCVELATKRIWIVNSSLPNTLTPNGDGINDVFMRDWHIQVYNRNGILLYEGIDGWDGSYKGEKVTNDTYFYVLYFVAESGTKTRTGYITVIR